MTIHILSSTNLWKHCNMCGCHYLGGNCYGLHVTSRFDILTILLESKITNKPSKIRFHHQVHFDFVLIVISKLLSIKTRMVVMFTTTLSSK